VSAGEDGTVRVWDWLTLSDAVLLGSHYQASRRRAWNKNILPDTHELPREWLLPAPAHESHVGPAHCAAVSPDGKLYASGGQDKTVRVWEAATGKNVATLERHTGTVCSVCFGAGGLLASGGADKSVIVWDAGAGKVRSELKGHTGAVACLATGPTGLLASGSEDGTVRVWDVGTGRARLTLGGGREAVLSLALSPDGKRVAAGGNNGSVWVWEAESGKEVFVSRQGGAVQGLCFTPDAKVLAVGYVTDRDCLLKLCAASTGDAVGLPEGWWLGCRGEGGAYWGGFMFHPDGRTLVGVPGGRLAVWGWERATEP
jgi:WD40 repeat protein